MNSIATGESPVDYVSAVALREISYISSYARALPQNHTPQSQGEIGDPAAHLQSLNDYLALAPFLVPSKDSALSAFCLWHPNLNGSNIYVSNCVHGDGLPVYEITDVIGWQHALIAPMYLQTRMPSIIRQVGPKEGAPKASPAALRRRLDTLSQKELDVLARQVLLNAYSANSPTAIFTTNPLLKTMSDPIHLASSTNGTLWSESLPPFRSALTSVAENWNDIWTELHESAGIPSCPVQSDIPLLGVLEEQYEIWAASRAFLASMMAKTEPILPNSSTQVTKSNNLLS